jgi:hypothetical protein
MITKKQLAFHPFSCFSVETMLTENQHAKKKQPFFQGNVIAWFRRNGLMARLRSTIVDHVPVGYEDETGFHIAKKPSPVRSDPDSGTKLDRS